jgi:DNA repair exonuclease SbcCD ATPase subunit
MQVLTFWLIAGTLALALAIAALEWNKPRKKTPLVPITSSSSAVVENKAFTQQEAETTPILVARITILEQKSRLAHERIQRVENILSGIPLDKLEQQLDTGGIQKKIEALLAFQQETRKQIKELEQRLGEKSNWETEEAEQQLDELEKELAQQNQSLQELENKVPAISRKNPKRKK